MHFKSSFFIVNILEFLFNFSEICNVSGVFLSKVLAQRCLWCLSTQNLPEKHVDQRYSEIFQFIEQIINSTETNSPLVRLEIISVLQK